MTINITKNGRPFIDLHDVVEYDAADTDTSRIARAWTAASILLNMSIDEMCGADLLVTIQIVPAFTDADVVYLKRSNV